MTRYEGLARRSASRMVEVVRTAASGVRLMDGEGIRADAPLNDVL